MEKAPISILSVFLFLAIAFAPSSVWCEDLLIVLNKSDDTASILDAKSGAARATIAVGHAPHEVEVLADGKTAAVSNYGTREGAGRTVSLIDLEKNALSATIDVGEGARPHGLKALPNGQLLVTAEGTKELLVVDPQERRVVARIPTGKEVSHMVVASPDGKRAFVANIGAGSITVVDLQTNSAVKDIPTGQGAEGIDITPNGREVWVANRGADSVSIVDARALSVSRSIMVPQFPIRVKIAPDGKRALVSCARSGDVAVIDVAKLKELKRIPIGQEAVPDAEKRLLSNLGKSPAPVGLLIAPDGKSAWVASTNADIVTEISLESMSAVRRLTAGKEPDGLAGVFRNAKR